MSRAVTRTEARLHDGTSIPVAVFGSGPDVLIPLRTEPHAPDRAAAMRQWGADPDLGAAIVDGLAASYRVIAADYEGHRLGAPAAGTLTPENLARDLLAVADAARSRSFAYYGYSWLALSGLQLALRTDRLWALAMGGFPPLDGPYQEMLAVTRAAHAMATQAQDAGPAPETAGEPTPGDWSTVRVEADPAQTAQFVTLYEALQDFDDGAAQATLRLPRLCFAGSEDEIAYGPGWGDVVVRIAAPLIRHRQRLERDGWRVDVLPGLDHLGAMQGDVVLRVVRPWLATAARPIPA
jgi:pimeloyl-ACP methyl ester carboxylesterase